MGISNRKAALETKLAHLLGELKAKHDLRADTIARVKEFPALEARISELERAIEAVETVIKFDHPNWQRDTINPIRPQVHQIPIKIGEATRKALEVLRDAEGGMTFREIARELLRRDNVEADRVTLDKVTNSIGNTLRVKTDILASDGGWPAKWRVIR